MRAKWHEDGVVLMEDTAALAAGVDLLCRCVTDDAGVWALLMQTGLLAAMRPGGMVAVHATIRPESCLEPALIASRNGIDLVDMPVSGSGHAAAAGRLPVLSGGPREAIVRILPLRKAMPERSR